MTLTLKPLTQLKQWYLYISNLILKKIKGDFLKSNDVYLPNEKKNQPNIFC